MNLRNNLCVELILAILVVTLDNGSCLLYSDPRNKSLNPVSLPGFPKINSYTGYFTLSDEGFFESFIWYFPARVDPDKAPVVLLFEDPFSVTFPSVSSKRNGPSSNENVDPSVMQDISWNKKQHIIYIDSLAHNSYSFTGEKLLELQFISDKIPNALLQFFEIFPELRNNDFFVAGDNCYSQYVIKISSLIHSRNKHAPQDKKINLKGMMVGNGLIAQESQIHFGEYLYESGLIDAKGRDIFLEEEKKALNFLSKHQSDKARDVLNNLIFHWSTQFHSLTGYQVGYKGRPLNILDDGLFRPNTDYIKWIEQDSIRRVLGSYKTRYVGIHWVLVGVEEWNVVSSQLNTLADLSEHYRVLIYSGNFDVLAPYPVVENMIDNLPSPSADEIKRAERQEWVVGGELAGYIRKGGNLTQVLIRNAGLFPTTDQPKWIIKLTELFTHESL